MSASTDAVFRYPAYPFDHQALDEKYRKIGEDYEKDRQESLKNIQAEYGPGCDGGANAAALLAVVGLVAFWVTAVIASGADAFFASTAAFGCAIALAFLLDHVRIPQPRHYEQQTKNTNDLYDRWIRSNAETGAKVLKNRRNGEERLRKDWQAIKAGEGGFDLYIREVLSNRQIEKVKRSFKHYVVFLYQYVWDQELADRGVRPGPKGIGVNTKRLSVWERRRRRDQEQGLPVTLAEEAEALDQARISRAQSVFKKTELQTADPVLAGYLSGLEKDKAEEEPAA